MSDLNTLFLGEHNTWIFLLECALRAGLMFVITLALMKISGKKEVRQFSVLELLVIIGLGSALGDPMIYTDSPLLPSAVAMGTVLFCYWALNKWTNRAPKLERFIEGHVNRVLHEGAVDRRALDAEGLSVAEFFGDLRVLHVEHLGQVKTAYVEIDGKVSVFFREQDQPWPGLPLAPEILARSTPLRTQRQFPCCCVHCGLQVQQEGQRICSNCGTDAWVPAWQGKRIT
jgi:uncharacterized membrane protein YcaP (DUF421 family)